MTQATDKIDFETKITPDEVWRRITATSDEKKIMFFAASGHAGNHPFLYEINSSEIKVIRRQRRKNIPPILTIKISRTDYGSRIVGNIAVELSSWIVLALLTGISLIIGGSLTFFAVNKLLAGTPLTSFSPVDLVGLIFLIEAFILPVICILKVRYDSKVLFDWLKSLVADSLVVK